MKLGVLWTSRAPLLNGNGSKSRRHTVRPHAPLSPSLPYPGVWTCAA